MEAEEIFELYGKVTLREGCDCGDQIRHNNGGNYHQVIRLRKRWHLIEVQYDSTSDLTPEPEWELCQDWQAVLDKYCTYLASAS